MKAQESCNKAWLAGALCVVISLPLVAGAAAPDDYPNRPLRFIVPFPAGGSTDIIARIIGQQLTESMGRPVVIDNRPGANTVIGTEAVVRAAPDGNTLLLMATSFTVNPSAHARLPYDSLTDLAAVSRVAYNPLIICVHPSLQVTNVKQLIALAKAKPGALNFASGGVGSPLHLAGELFKQDTKTEMVHVAYKGTAPAAYDLLSGQMQVMFPSVISMYPYIKAGKVRVVAVMSAKRSPTLPEVQTTVESGLSQLTASIWFGLVAPKNTSTQIVQQLHEGVLKALANKDFRERLLRDDVDPVGNTPQEFTAYAQAEYAKWSRVIRGANIKVE